MVPSNCLRNVSRLFHEHFADVPTSRLGFTRSDVQLKLSVDSARNVFIAMHVDDLIVVGSSSQQNEVVSEMKVCHHESHSSALCQCRTDVCGREVLATQ